MLKEYTCIMCPRGCDISAQVEDGRIVSIEGASCQKGTDYVHQELTDPRRNIATSILVEDGDLPLVSVKLDAPIPKDKIFEVMEEIKKVKTQAPVSVGQILLENVLGLNCNVIATKKVECNK
jgi:CxxC motif-containing protein